LVWWGAILYYAQSRCAIQALKDIEWIWFSFIHRLWKSSFHPIF
jgi:hypothetical protein